MRTNFTGRFSRAEHTGITSFSLLFLMPRTRSVRFLSNIRSKFPFTLRSAIVAFKKLNAVFAISLLGGFVGHRPGVLTCMDNTLSR